MSVMEMVVQGCTALAQALLHKALHHHLQSLKHKAHPTLDPKNLHNREDGWAQTIGFRAVLRSLKPCFIRPFTTISNH